MHSSNDVACGSILASFVLHNKRANFRPFQYVLVQLFQFIVTMLKLTSYRVILMATLSVELNPLGSVTVN